MPFTHEEIFQRYTWFAMKNDADAQAGLFAVDGVFEAPLVPADGPFPRRMEGREEIRKGLAAVHQRNSTVDLKIDPAGSRYEVFSTTDPDVFMVETEASIEWNGEARMMSLLKIFRLRDGEIVLLRDYFDPQYA